VLKILSILLGVVILGVVAAWLTLRGPDIPYETLEAKYTDGASRFVDLPGGFHAHYQDEGDPRQPLLVLLHGFGTRSRRGQDGCTNSGVNFISSAWISQVTD
jgi:hypothetical protein